MLTSKIEKVIKRMQWNILEFLGKLDSNSSKNETYDFKSLKCPRAVEEIAQFENDLLLLIKNLEFKKVHNDFQMSLCDDIKEIKASNKMFVSTDKSRYIYKMKLDKYKNLLRDNITKTYKTSNGKLRDINFAANKVAEKLSIAERVEEMQETKAYITIKDHKDEFPHKIPRRLINPSKSKIGKISKAILDTINKNVVRSTEISQRKNTQNVLDWYANYTGKNKASFVQFDIQNFYPSITSNLLCNSIQFAKEVTTESDNNIHIIMQSRKTLLFNEKKNG